MSVWEPEHPPYSLTHCPLTHCLTAHYHLTPSPSPSQVRLRSGLVTVPGKEATSPVPALVHSLLELIERSILRKQAQGAAAEEGAGETADDADADGEGGSIEVDVDSANPRPHPHPHPHPSPDPNPKP